MLISIKRPNSQAGVTLPEVMVATLLVAVFFASIVELNAVCLRYIDATKETVAAIQTANDRIESIRNAAFGDILTENYMKTTTGVDTAGNPLPGNGSPMPGLLVGVADSSIFASRVSEAITLTDYSTGSPGSISVIYNRAAGGSSTPVVTWSGGSSFPSSTTMVKTNVTVSWNMNFGGHSRTEQSETILSRGTKK